MKEIARILYGSQNYGLDTSESDEDYKLLLCPSFDDLYNYRKVRGSDVPAEYDPDHYSVMSVMQFHSLLINGNPNCIEMLFSKESIAHTDAMETYLDRAKVPFEQGYIALVWDQFYSAIQGLALNSIDRNGVDAKTVSRAYYLYGMALQIPLDNYSITERTWRDRGSYYQLYSKRIRDGLCDGETLKSLCDYVREGFATSKPTLHSMAEKHCKSDPVNVAILETDISELNVRMKDIVAWNVVKEYLPTQNGGEAK